MAVRTRKRESVHTLGSGQIEPNFAKFNEFNVLATKTFCPTNEYDEIYYLLSSHHPVKC